MLLVKRLFSIFLLTQGELLRHFPRCLHNFPFI
ncbi:hypothetical protein VPHPS32B4_0069 [Vibrio phage PS32B-4]